MTRSTPKLIGLPADGNHARGYAVLDDGSLLPLAPSAPDDGNPQGGAGYVRSSVRDMLTWARAVLEAEAVYLNLKNVSKAVDEHGGRLNPLRQMQLMRCGHRPFTLQGKNYENIYFNSF